MIVCETISLSSPFLWCRNWCSQSIILNYARKLRITMVLLCFRSASDIESNFVPRLRKSAATNILYFFWQYASSRRVGQMGRVRNRLLSPHSFYSFSLGSIVQVLTVSFAYLHLEYGVEKDNLHRVLFSVVWNCFS